MKCPYCQKEMQPGYIQCRDGVYWTPKLQLIAALSVLGKDSIRLQKDEAMSNTADIAYNCNHCKKILIDY